MKNESRMRINRLFTPPTAASALIGALFATGVLAQLTNPGARRAAPPTTAAGAAANIGTQALLPDLTAARSGPATIVESYSETDPCTTHSHTHVLRLQLGGRFLPTYPTAMAKLYRDGQELTTWTVATTGLAAPVNLGSFSWTRDHPCPGGGASVTVGPSQPNNHRLVIDPNGAVQEASEQNNVLEFFVPPDAAWAKAQ
jgi:hypothetical protein